MPQAGLAANLLEPSVPGAAARFLAAWYGPRPAATVSAAHDELPPPLRELHELVARWPEAIRHNWLLSPGELRAIDDKIVFATENQSVVDWAFDPADPEGPVWTRSGADDPWSREPSSLSRFCVELVVFDAATTAPYGVWSDDDERAPRVLAELSRLPIGPWSWPTNTCFYAGDELLGLSWGDAEQCWIGALEEEPLGYIERIDSTDRPFEWWAPGWSGTKK